MVIFSVYPASPDAEGRATADGWNIDMYRACSATVRLENQNRTNVDHTFTALIDEGYTFLQTGREHVVAAKYDAEAISPAEILGIARGLKATPGL